MSTYGTRPFLRARLRRALEAPTGGVESLMRLKYRAASLAYRDLVALGFEDEADAIVQGFLLRERRERIHGHVGSARAMGAAFEAGR